MHKNVWPSTGNGSPSDEFNIKPVAYLADESHLGSALFSSRIKRTYVYVRVRSCYSRRRTL